MRKYHLNLEYSALEVLKLKHLTLSMDLKLSKLKKIPLRNKNLIFGYVKDNWEKINNAKK